MRKYIVVGLIVCALLLAACGQTTELPTLFPSSTPVPTEAETATPTQTPLTRPTLPPTWTFTPEPTPTPTVPTNTPAPVIVATLVPSCDTFGPDIAHSQREFMLGTSPKVAWTPVEGAGSYRIALIDQFGLVLREDYTADTSFSFAPELFKKGLRYGWEVVPLDERGIQMCYSRGEELLPIE